MNDLDSRDHEGRKHKRNSKARTLGMRRFGITGDQIKTDKASKALLDSAVCRM